MIKYILKRLLQMIPVLIGVMIIVFSLSYLMPGDPVLNQMPDNYTQEQYDEVQHEMGLDQPFLVQLSGALSGRRGAGCGRRLRRLQPPLGLVHRPDRR